MNYSILKKILMVSVVFTAYESNVDAAETAGYNKNYNNIINIKKPNNYLGNLNNNNYNKSPNYYNNNYVDNPNNNMNMRYNVNPYLKQNNNRFMRNININDINRVSSDYEPLLDTIIREFASVITSGDKSNEDIAVLLRKLSANESDIRFSDSVYNILRNIINSKKVNLTRNFGNNNVKSSAIDLLCVFNMVRDADLKVLEANNNIIFTVLLNAANHIDNDHCNSLRNLVLTNQSGDNSRDFLATIASIVEQSSISIGENEVSNMNSTLGLNNSNGFKLSRNGKIYSKYFMFEPYKALSDDNEKLINGEQLKARREQLNKLLRAVPVNEAVDDARYSMMLGSDMFDTGHKEALDAFIESNKGKSFASLADLCMKINVALGKKEFGELREQGVDNGKKEEKKKEHNGEEKMSVKEFYEKNGLKKYINKNGACVKGIYIDDRKVIHNIEQYRIMLKREAAEA